MMAELKSGVAKETRKNQGKWIMQNVWIYWKFWLFRRIKKITKKIIYGRNQV
jgi:hypothetical protein